MDEYRGKWVSPYNHLDMVAGVGPPFAWICFCVRPELMKSAMQSSRRFSSLVSCCRWNGVLRSDLPNIRCLLDD